MAFTAAKTRKFASAVTLIEVAIASAIMAIGVIGAASYRVNAALDEQNAISWRAAARIGLLVSGSWKGVKGYSLYDAEAHLAPQLHITKTEAKDVSEGYSANGTYLVVVDGREYYVTLAWKDLDVDLRILNVEVNWRPRITGDGSIDDSGKSFKLTSYISG